MYSWSSVAERLEKTYDKARMQEVPDRITRLRKGVYFRRHANATADSLPRTAFRYYQCGPIAGKIFCIIVALDMIVFKVLEWILPAVEMDRALGTQGL